MTLLLRRGALVGFGVIGISAVAVVLAGTLRALGAPDLPPDLKFLLERMLFICILAMTLLLLSFVYIVLRSRNISKELSRITALVRSRDFQPGPRLEKLGPFGDQVAELYHAINSLSEKKSVKISAQGALLEFLAANLQRRLAVTGLRGEILYASGPLLELWKRERDESVGRPLESMFPELGVQGVCREALQSRTPVVLDGEPQGSVYQITNRNRDIAYLAWLFEKGTAVQPGLHAGSEAAGPRGNTLLRLWERVRGKR